VLPTIIYRVKHVESGQEGVSRCSQDEAVLFIIQSILLALQTTSSNIITGISMPYHSPAANLSNEAAEPLFSDGDGDFEKHELHDVDADAERQRLLSSILRLKVWLVAVCITLGIALLYSFYTFRGGTSDHRTLKRLTFAPSSMYEDFPSIRERTLTSW